MIISGPVCSDWWRSNWGVLRKPVTMVPARLRRRGQILSFPLSPQTIRASIPARQSTLSPGILALGLISAHPTVSSPAYPGRCLIWRLTMPTFVASGVLSFPVLLRMRPKTVETRGLLNIRELFKKHSLLAAGLLSLYTCPCIVSRALRQQRRYHL
jgi:hypothetical protein